MAILEMVFGLSTTGVGDGGGGGCLRCWNKDFGGFRRFGIFFVMVMMVFVPQPASLSNPCSNPVVLNQAWRDVAIDNAPQQPATGQSYNKCDKGMITSTDWYSFRLDTQPAMIPTACVKDNMCGASVGMRVELEGQELPSEVGQNISASLCGAYNVLDKYDCCVLRSPVTIARCPSNTYVYQFPQPLDRCPVAICAKKIAVPHPPATLAKHGETYDITTTPPVTDATTTATTTTTMLEMMQNDDPNADFITETTASSENGNTNSTSTPTDIIITRSDSTSTTTTPSDVITPININNDNNSSSSATPAAITTSSSNTSTITIAATAAVDNNNDNNNNNISTVASISTPTSTPENTSNTAGGIESSPSSSSSSSSSSVASTASAETTTSTTTAAAASSYSAGDTAITTPKDKPSSVTTTNTNSTVSVTATSLSTKPRGTLDDVTNITTPYNKMGGFTTKPTSFGSVSSSSSPSSTSSASSLSPSTTASLPSSTSSHSPSPLSSSSSESLPPSTPSSSRQPITFSSSSSISSPPSSSQPSSPPYSSSSPPPTTATPTPTTSVFLSSLTSRAAATTTSPSQPSTPSTPLHPSSSPTSITASSTPSSSSFASSTTPGSTDPLNPEVLMTEQVRLVFKGGNLAYNGRFPSEVARTIKSFLLEKAAQQSGEGDGPVLVNVMSVELVPQTTNRSTILELRISHSMDEVSLKTFRRGNLDAYIYTKTNLTLLATCRPSKKCGEEVDKGSGGDNSSNKPDAATGGSSSSSVQKNLPVLIAVLCVCGVCIIVMVTGVVCAKCRHRGVYKADSRQDIKLRDSRTYFDGGTQSPFTDVQIMKDETPAGAEGGSVTGSAAAEDGGADKEENTWVVPLEEVDLDNEENGGVAEATEDTKL